MPFRSRFSPSIERYLEYRKGMNYGGEGEKRYLMAFDKYCAEYFPETDSLTKELFQKKYYPSSSVKDHLAKVYFTKLLG